MRKSPMLLPSFIFFNTSLCPILLLLQFLSTLKAIFIFFFEEYLVTCNWNLKVRIVFLNCIDLYNRIEGIPFKYGRFLYRAKYSCKKLLITWKLATIQIQLSEIIEVTEDNIC